MATFKKIIGIIKVTLIKLLIAFAIGGIVLLTRFSAFGIIIPFALFDCILGYVYQNKIMANKHRLLALSRIRSNEEPSQETNFNSDYYDLYWDFNYNRLFVMLRSVALGLSLTPVLFEKINELEVYVTCGMLLMILPLLIVSLTLFAGKRNTIISQLINERRENWYDKYTDKEIELLSQLGSVDYRKSNNK